MNHAFEVGKTYLDHVGTYKVVAIDGSRLVFATADGIEHEGNTEIKWQIYRSILSGESAPHTSPSLQRSPSGNGATFITNDEASPIFADVIKAYGKSYKDFMTHEKIVAAFMEHPEGRLILNRPHNGSKLYWTGVKMAWFSRVFTEGSSPWEGFFERKKIGSAWAYRVRCTCPISLEESDKMLEWSDFT